MYWFPRMDNIVEGKVKECIICVMSDKTKKQRSALVSPVSVPLKPWIKLGLDITGPLKLSMWTGKFMLVLVDYHSYWIM